MVHSECDETLTETRKGLLRLQRPLKISQGVSKNDLTY